ncbi:MAG: hypothetical protein V3V53_14780 [Bacteroidales bacterium]
METRLVDLHGYKDCIEIRNGDSRVVLEPNCGGRILYYEYKGVNALYINPADDGYLLESGKSPAGPLSPCAGRCDIGPEMTIPPHPDLWLGNWIALIQEDQSVEMTSMMDHKTGIQLTRTVSLEEHFAKLKFTQGILNISESPKQYFHWSRTFCNGGGIAIAPVNPDSRFPNGYITYGPGDIINYRPDCEPNVCIHDGLLQIFGPSSTKKFAMDLSEGWLAYLTRDSHLFVKKFPVYPGRVYGEIAANNMSFWYNDEETCEIEPLGPLEVIQPSYEASFTETWYLMEYDYPGRTAVKSSDIRKIIDILVM